MGPWLGLVTSPGYCLSLSVSWKGSESLGCGQNTASGPYPGWFHTQTLGCTHAWGEGCPQGHFSQPSPPHPETLVLKVHFVQRVALPHRASISQISHHLLSFGSPNLVTDPRAGPDSFFKFLQLCRQDAKGSSQASWTASQLISLTPDQHLGHSI